MSQLETARKAVKIAQDLGADEVKAWVTTGGEVELQQRAGKLERVHEASTLGLSVSLLVDDRFSSHSTSDLRPEALRAFLDKAVSGTRYLEADPDRKMAPREQMGSLDLATLDCSDEAPFEQREAALRREEVGVLEQAVLAGAGEDLVSATVYLWEMRNRAACAFSNGFEGQRASTHYGYGGMVTLKEPSGKLPEAYSFVNSTHLADRLSVDELCADLWRSAGEVRDTSACESKRVPMLLDRRVAGRILGALLAPLGGGNLHQGRSCMHDKLGKKLGSDAFTLVDDPTIPRGLGSRPFDSDGFPARVRPVFDRGELQTWFVGLYHARKLGCEPTTGSTSNLVMEPGARHWTDIAKDMPECIRVTSFLGGNSNPTSGDFSFGIRGQLFRDGEWVQNLSEMNVTGNLLELIGRFVEADNEPWLYASARLPTLVFEDVQFSGL